MSTIMFEPETLQAQNTSQEDARKQVDELIQQEQKAIAEFRTEKHDDQAMPPVPAGNIFVWFDRACYGNGAPGFYYVRDHSGRSWYRSTYDRPRLIVKKSKLRPDQVDFMERKCQETYEEERQAAEQAKSDQKRNTTWP